VNSVAVLDTVSAVRIVRTEEKRSRLADGLYVVNSVTVADTVRKMWTIRIVRTVRPE
jgi:hypothetical protein